MLGTRLWGLGQRREHTKSPDLWRRPVSVVQSCLLWPISGHQSSPENGTSGAPELVGTGPSTSLQAVTCRQWVCLAPRTPLRPPGHRLRPPSPAPCPPPPWPPSHCHLPLADMLQTFTCAVPSKCHTCPSPSVASSSHSTASLPHTWAGAPLHLIYLLVSDALHMFNCMVS